MQNGIEKLKSNHKGENMPASEFTFGSLFAGI